MNKEMNMPYKVVFVEDEIVTREGIRDNVNWKNHGFEFCGEATDGEMALQLLLATKPDVLITDIKMPFMDGLQLCKFVRERMPGVVIVILSGHDEFEYAHEAIKLGVTEYLLKPVTVQDIHCVLDRIAAHLDQEKKEREDIQRLKDQIEENQLILRERFLLKLILGAVSSTDAIEKSQVLGLDIVARHYLVVIVKIELADRSEQFDYSEYQRVQQIISGLVENNPDTFLLRKDWEELVILMKGNTAEYLEEERDFLLELISQKMRETRYRLTIGIGAPKNRITHIHQSFVEALVNIQNVINADRNESTGLVNKTDLLMVDKTAVENYLRCGTKDQFDSFFDVFISPLGEAALKSYLIKNYIFMDIILATAKFLNELGGDIDHVVAGFTSIEMMLMRIKTIEQLKEQVQNILISALIFRDNLASRQYAGVIKQVQNYINYHYMDPDLSLGEVAAQANLSPSHFSVIFSQETCKTFMEYLSEVRIKKAKELLRTTSLRSVDISCQIGYNDPHYFSYVFRKNTGLTPTEFRLQTQAG
jgi:two-component system response regulator YesN